MFRNRIKPVSWCLATFSAWSSTAPPCFRSVKPAVSTRRRQQTTALPRSRSTWFLHRLRPFAPTDAKKVKIDGENPFIYWPRLSIIRPGRRGWTRRYIQDILECCWPFKRTTPSSRSTQPSIPPGSVNEYQLRLGRQRQVWLFPIADERVGVQVKLWNHLRTRAIPERFCGGDSLRRSGISSVCTLTFTFETPPMPSHPN